MTRPRPTPPGQLTLPLPDLDPDSWCQRWRHRTPGWQHRHLGGFDADRYTVIPLDARTARIFVLQHHYAASWPKTQLSYGLIDTTPHLDDYPDPHPTARTPHGRLVGVAALSIPMHPAVLTNPFPGLTPTRESLDLGRFVLLDPVPGNAESWFLARVFRLAAHAGIGGIVAFSDPHPRYRGTTLILPGHHGIAYQSHNARYLGTTRGGPLVLFDDATSMPARTLTKIVSQAPGWRGAVDRFVHRGAPPWTGREPAAHWLAVALPAAGATVIDHPGTLKYAWQIRPGRAARIAQPAQRYPKPSATHQHAADAAQATDDGPGTMAGLPSLGVGVGVPLAAGASTRSVGSTSHTAATPPAKERPGAARANSPPATPTCTATPPAGPSPPPAFASPHCAAPTRRTWPWNTSSPSPQPAPTNNGPASRPSGRPTPPPAARPVSATPTEPGAASPPPTATRSDPSWTRSN